MRFAALLLLSVVAHAAVRRVEILDRAPIANNYERLTGRVYFGADPKLPANRIVRDLEFAPVNARGEVEFSAEFYLLRPRDAAKSNGTVLFEVSNRGGKGMLSRFNFSQPGEFGDGYAMQQGYTLAWLGWEWDIPASAATILHFTAPRFRPDALPAPGLVRSEFVPDRTVTAMPLGDRVMDPIAVVQPLALYVRDSGDLPSRKIARRQMEARRRRPLRRDGRRLRNRQALRIRLRRQGPRRRRDRPRRHPRLDLRT